MGMLCCVLVITSCGSKQSDAQKNQADSSLVQANAEAPYADTDLDNTTSAQLGGKTYSIRITRKADKALPIVTDDIGKKYYDNRVDVVITCNGEDFFSKSYTRESFAAHLSSDETQGAVLLGMAFDSVKSDNHAIYLGAQVGQIGIEDGPAFSIEIPLDGSEPNIVRDKTQDTSGEDSLGD